MGETEFGIADWFFFALLLYTKRESRRMTGWDCKSGILKFGLTRPFASII